MEKTEIIFRAVEIAILFVSACLIIPQVFLLKKQMKDDHEERRRENTTRVMEIWCSTLKKDTSIAEQVARKLNQDQCKKLYNHKPFEVSESIKEDICKFCPLEFSECEKCSLNDKNNKVDGKILTELRWHVITYLNTLETVMVSWHLGVVDREIIEEQFEFLKDANKGTTLTSFRHSAGGYPMIEEFIDEIKDDGPKTKKKDRID